MDSEKLAKVVLQRGVDFAPSEYYLRTLRGAGARQALLDVLQAVAKKPLSEDDLLHLVVSRVPTPQIVKLVKERGLDSKFSQESLDTLRIAGADDCLLASLGEAKPLQLPSPKLPPPRVEPTETVCGAGEYEAGLTPPILISQTQPQYTDEARRAHLEGSVALCVVVNMDGSVGDTKEISGHLGKGLDEAAMEMVRSWKFKPAMRTGIPVQRHIRVEITFRLS
jgi:TonB family protein